VPGGRRPRRDSGQAMSSRPSTGNRPAAPETWPPSPLSKKPGETVKLDYIRVGKSQTNTVTLGAQP
jgi:hypothetical protein